MKIIIALFILCLPLNGALAWQDNVTQKPGRVGFTASKHDFATRLPGIVAVKPEAQSRFALDGSALNNAIADEPLTYEERFFKYLPEGQYIALHYDIDGKVVRRQTLGNPFLVHEPHRDPITGEFGGGGFTEAETGYFDIKLSDRVPTATIKIGVRRGDEIVFLDQTIYVAD